MKHAVVILFVMLSLGCGSAAKQRYEARDADTIKQYGAMMILPDCDSSLALNPKSILQYAKCGDPIYEQAKHEADGHVNGCKKNKVKPKDCIEQFQSMITSRMQLRYRFADKGTIELKCQAFPADCKTLWKLEGWFSESHNQYVFSALMKQHLENGSAYLNESQQERRDHQKVWQNMFRAAPSVSCTSTQLGNTVQTECDR